MTEPESAGSAYSKIDELSRLYSQEEGEVEETVRLFAVEVAGDVVTMDGQEVLEAALQLDERASSDERVTREVVHSMKLVDTFRERSKHPERLQAADVEQSEARALRDLRAALATRQFRVGYPERFEAEGNGYYSSSDFVRGSSLTEQLVTEYLAGVESQTDGTG